MPGIFIHEYETKKVVMEMELNYIEICGNDLNHSMVEYTEENVASLPVFDSIAFFEFFNRQGKHYLKNHGWYISERVKDRLDDISGRYNVTQVRSNERIYSFLYLDDVGIDFIIKEYKSRFGGGNPSVIYKLLKISRNLKIDKILT